MIQLYSQLNRHWREGGLQFLCCTKPLEQNKRKTIIKHSKYDIVLGENVKNSWLSPCKNDMLNKKISIQFNSLCLEHKKSLKTRNVSLARGVYKNLAFARSHFWMTPSLLVLYTAKKPQNYL